MKLYYNGEEIGDITTNRSLTIKEALYSLGYDLDDPDDLEQAYKDKFPAAYLDDEGNYQIDEENIMLALYASRVSKAKVVTKIGRIDFEEVVEDLNLGSVVYPKNITAENIVRFVRALDNASGNNAETLYQLLDGRVEAAEFVVGPSAAAITGVKLQALGLKKDLLVCCINRKGKIITPTGQDTLEIGDIVVIVTTAKGIRDLRDIVR